MKLSSFLPAAALAATPAMSHPEWGGFLVHQEIKLTEVTATTDQDDGGGESEYCFRAKLVHAGHPAAQVDMVRCYDVDWDDPSKSDPTKEFHELKEPKLPLLGGDGAVDSDVVISRHTACTDTKPWDLEVTLYEVDYSPAGEILNDIASLIEDELEGTAKLFQLNDPRILALTGFTAKAARLAGKWIDRIVNDTEDLGRYNANFKLGQYDPAGEGSADNSKIRMHFNGDATKRVETIGICDYSFFQFFLDGSMPLIMGNAACLRSENSPLCVNPGAASQEQFATLAAAAARTDAITPETGTEATEEGAVELRRNLMGLAAAYATGAIDAQLTALAANPEAGEIVYEVSGTLQEARALEKIAMTEASGAMMSEVIAVYGQVHEVLANAAFGDAFMVEWDAHFSNTVNEAMATARAAHDRGDHELAQSLVAQTLLAWAALDAETRDKFAPLMFDVTNLPIDTLTDFSLREISTQIVELF
ncbi:MAG: hypothetical protein AAGI10_04975 [Pseudomonadota bacterium]